MVITSQRENPRNRWIIHENHILVGFLSKGIRKISKVSSGDARATENLVQSLSLDLAIMQWFWNVFCTSGNCSIRKGWIYLSASSRLSGDPENANLRRRVNSGISGFELWSGCRRKGFGAGAANHHPLLKIDHRQKVQIQICAYLAHKKSSKQTFSIFGTQMSSTQIFLSKNVLPHCRGQIFAFSLLLPPTSSPCYTPR